MFYIAEVIDFKTFQVASALQKHDPHHLPIDFTDGISYGWSLTSAFGVLSGTFRSAVGHPQPQ